MYRRIEKGLNRRFYLLSSWDFPGFNGLGVRRRVGGYTRLLANTRLVRRPRVQPVPDLMLWITKPV